MQSEESLMKGEEWRIFNEEWAKGLLLMAKEGMGIMEGSG